MRRWYYKEKNEVQFLRRKDSSQTIKVGLYVQDIFNLSEVELRLEVSLTGTPNQDSPSALSVLFLTFPILASTGPYFMPEPGFPLVSQLCSRCSTLLSGKLRLYVSRGRPELVWSRCQWQTPWKNNLVFSRLKLDPVFLSPHSSLLKLSGSDRTKLCMQNYYCNYKCPGRIFAAIISSLS